MNAGGGDEGSDEVKRISRITAAWELSKRIRHSAALGRHIILVRPLFNWRLGLAHHILKINRQVTLTVYPHHS